MTKLGKMGIIGVVLVLVALEFRNYFVPKAIANQSTKLFVVSRQGGTSTNEVYRFEVSGPNDTPSLNYIITDSNFDNIYGLAFSPSGELFVTNFSTSNFEGHVSRFLNPTGVPVANGLITSNEFSGPTGAIFYNNELFIVNTTGSNVLRFVFDASGNSQFNGSFSDGLSGFASRNIAVNPTGELFVSRSGLNEINRYLTDNNQNVIFNGIITGGGLNNPHDLMFSPWGELFVVNANGNSVSRFTFDGTGVATPNGQITGNGLDGPLGLDFSPWGELFVANLFNATISRFTFDSSYNAIPNGSFSTPNTLSDLQFFPTIPTTTPTPTPTPIPVTKVVVVPGFGASWNSDAILGCKLDNYSGGWGLALYAAHIYNPLISALDSSGYIAMPFYYDWRKQATESAGLLSDYIDTNTIINEKVHTVGHSMGGLVGRAYLEDEGENHNLDRLLTVGSPHRGVATAYPSWSAGEIWDDNLVHRIAKTLLLKNCGIQSRRDDRNVIRTFIPSTQNLLPIVDYLRDWRTGLPKPVTQMDAQNNWLPTDNFSFPFFGATVGALSGTGFPTLEFINVRERSERDEGLGNWADGEPTRRENTEEGDGTVLASSSHVDGAQNLTINKTHNGLMASPDGITEILGFLGAPGATSLGASFVEPTSALVIIGHPAMFWITSPDGTTHKDTDHLVAIMNPKSGAYKLRLLPKSASTRFIVAQFLEDGRTLWKEYSFKNILPKFGNIRYNPLEPVEDALMR